MGQKVNPHGLRVGVNKDWNSKWYAGKNDFADFLIEDQQIRNYVKKTLYAAGVASVVVERPAADKVRVVILAARPGMVIGRAGDGVEELKKSIRDGYGADTSVVCLHGKMKAEEKNRILQDFADGKISILVSTTVIEVGINNPNATVMMVENAERFGLAQLHQLRGRVGRGNLQSYCIFMSGKKDKDTMERLNVLEKSNDGFYIAGEDLKMRGPGDFFGIRQSGELMFKLQVVTHHCLSACNCQPPEGEVEAGSRRLEHNHTYRSER